MGRISSCQPPLSANPFSELLFLMPPSHVLFAAVAAGKELAKSSAREAPHLRAMVIKELGLCDLKALLLCFHISCNLKRAVLVLLDQGFSGDRIG